LHLRGLFTLEINAMDAMFCVFDRDSASQAGRHRFESDSPECVLTGDAFDDFSGFAGCELSGRPIGVLL
jgi:hypothetical protein